MILGIIILIVALVLLITSGYLLSNGYPGFNLLLISIILIFIGVTFVVNIRDKKKEAIAEEKDTTSVITEDTIRKTLIKDWDRLDTVTFPEW